MPRNAHHGASDKPARRETQQRRQTRAPCTGTDQQRIEHRAVLPMPEREVIDHPAGDILGIHDLVVQHLAQQIE